MGFQGDKVLEYERQLLGAATQKFKGRKEKLKKCGLALTDVVDKQYLGTCYDNICSDLNNQFQKHIERTPTEWKIFGLLCRVTKLKIFNTVWIGVRNFDLLLPQIGGLVDFDQRFVRHKGLIIEVDGPPHNWEPKMRKDEAKYHLAQSIGIAVTSIPNSDCEEALVRSFLKQISKFPRLDHRAIQRVWARIHAVTFLSFAVEDDFIDMYGLNNLRGGIDVCN